MARKGWLSGGALPELPSDPGPPDVVRAGPPVPMALGGPEAGPHRSPPPVARPAQPVPRSDGRREGFVGRIAAAEVVRRGWRVAAGPRGHAGPQLASVASHAALLAGILLIWGGATVVPAPPAELTIGLQFAETPSPPAAEPPPPAKASPPPPAESPAPPPPAEAPPPPPAEAALPVPPIPVPPIPVPPIPVPPPPVEPPPREKPEPRRRAETRHAARPEPRRTTPTPAAPAPAKPAEPERTAPTPPTRMAPASVAAAPRLLGELAGSCPGVYPPAALRRGLQGRVLVRAHVAPDGTPEEVAVARTSGFEQLDRAALEAVRACRRFPRATGAYVAEVPYAFILTN